MMHPEEMALVGQEYPARCNPLGAVIVITPAGEIGVKPDEYEVILAGEEWCEMCTRDSVRMLQQTAAYKANQGQEGGA